MLRRFQIPLVFAVGVVLGCTVAINEELKYPCSTDAECGGDGYLCAVPVTGQGYCCKPTGAEQCNGLDDDCNGKIDDGFPAREALCDNTDDDCDGNVDEDFLFQSDPNNCGTCGTTCDAGTQTCLLGQCRPRGELNCSDGTDNDNDGLIDCVDQDCNFQPCGLNCSCRNGLKAEIDCVNGVDDDGDSQVDCADSDCAAQSCGQGCACTGGAKHETICNDGIDNDSESGADCLDTDCAGALCQTGNSAFRCFGTQCTCGDAGVVNENTAATCRDGKDNDCDGLVDCQEASCDGQSCAADGGTACLCRNGTRTENRCNDGLDNDGDGKTDCADMNPDGGGDCAIGAACEPSPPPNRTCQLITNRNVGQFCP